MKSNENYIQLKFFGFNIDHKEISDSMGLQPTQKWSKGDKYKSGRLEKIRKENHWGFEIVTETNDFIGDQAKAFLADIVLPRTREIRSLTNTCHGEFSIIQYMYDSVNPGLYLDKDQIGILHDCGLELNVDIYVLSEKND